MTAPAGNTSTDAAAPGMERPGLVRALKAAVIGMGILILVGLGAVIWRIVDLASSPKVDRPADALASTDASAVPVADVMLALPAGAAVRSMTLDGDRLAVHYEAPEGAGIALIDLKSGRTVSRVRISPAKP